MSEPTNATPIHETVRGRAYTRGWRYRRDGVPRERCMGVSEFNGWDEADLAVKAGRDIEWSKPSNGWVEVEL